jgi:hypothetical protein
MVITSEKLLAFGYGFIGAISALLYIGSQVRQPTIIRDSLPIVVFNTLLLLGIWPIMLPVGLVWWLDEHWWRRSKPIGAAGGKGAEGGGDGEPGRGSQGGGGGQPCNCNARYVAKGSGHIPVHALSCASRKKSN